MFATTVSTLTAQSAFFESLVSGRNPPLRDDDHLLFVDRSPALFSHILEYMRTGMLFVSGADDPASGSDKRRRGRGRSWRHGRRRRRRRWRRHERGRSRESRRQSRRSGRTGTAGRSSVRSSHRVGSRRGHRRRRHVANEPSSPLSEGLRSDDGLESTEGGGGGGGGGGQGSGSYSPLSGRSSGSSSSGWEAPSAIFGGTVLLLERLLVESEYYMMFGLAGHIRDRLQELVGCQRSDGSSDAGRRDRLRTDGVYVLSGPWATSLVDGGEAYGGVGGNDVAAAAAAVATITSNTSPLSSGLTDLLEPGGALEFRSDGRCVYAAGPRAHEHLVVSHKVWVCVLFDFLLLGGGLGGKRVWILVVG